MILLLTDLDLETRHVITFSLESRFNSEVIAVNDTNAAIDVISQKPIEMVVCDHKKHSGDIATFIEFKKLNIPCLALTEAESAKLPPPPRIAAMVDSTNVIDDISKKVEGLFESGVLDRSKRKFNYCRIRTEVLLSASPLKTDVYIRLSDEKYIKLFKEGDDFNRIDFEKYTLQKGVGYLYLRNDECDEFLTKFATELKKKVNDPKADVSKIEEALVESLETVNEMVRKVGFTGKVQALVKENVGLSVKAMGADPQFKNIIAKLHVDKEKFIPSHTMLLAHMSCAIASALEWTSEQTFQKLTLAAMLHDITLENHELAAIHSMKDLQKKRKDFTAQEFNDYRDHPEKGAMLAKQMREVPADVDLIILQHHERPDGTGFPRRSDAGFISPLSAIIIIAEDMVIEAFLKQDKFNIQKFYTDKLVEYASGNFKQVLKVLTKVKL